MKLKNVKVGMEVVVKITSTVFTKGDIVIVTNIDLEDEDHDVRIRTSIGDRYWLNHKDIKKIKPEKHNSNVVTLDASKDDLVDFR